MKKISIITVANTLNYGSALQTLASLKILDSMGYEVEFVDYEGYVQSDEIAIKKRVALAENPIKKLVVYFFAKNNRKQLRKVFRGFIKNNIPLTAIQYHSYEELEKNVPEADIYCTGSDQVWNSGWNGGIVKSFFLEYAPEGKPRISLATSIGKEKFDLEEEEETVKLLKKYDWITVREKSAEKLLEQYNI